MSLRWTEDDLAAYRKRREAQQIDARRRGPSEPNLARRPLQREPIVAFEVGRADRAVTKAAVAADFSPLVGLCRAAGLAEPVPECRFHPSRRWRFDYAWPLVKLALEIDGGVWTQGRHTRGAGRIEDMEKLSEAAILGWRVLYATPEEVRSGVALDRIQRALAIGSGA